MTIHITPEHLEGFIDQIAKQAASGELLRCHAHLSGTVLDLPRAAAAARATARREHLDVRMDAVEGSFFHQIPSGADAYVLAACRTEFTRRMERAGRLTRLARSSAAPR